MEKPRDEEILVVGYGKFPQNTSAEQVHQVLAIAVRVNHTTGTILDASTTLLARTADDFVRELLVGRSLTTNVGDLVEQIRRQYQGHAQKAIVAAYRDLVARYLDFMA